MWMSTKLRNKTDVRQLFLKIYMFQRKHLFSVEALIMGKINQQLEDKLQVLCISQRMPLFVSMIGEFNTIHPVFQPPTFATRPQNEAPEKIVRFAVVLIPNCQCQVLAGKLGRARLEKELLVPNGVQVAPFY